MGSVTFTFTADNGTSDTGDDREGNFPDLYRGGGRKPALNIPEGASRNRGTAERRRHRAVDFQCNSVCPGQEFAYTVELFEGNYATEADLAGKTPIGPYSVPNTQTSFVIPENVLDKLSVGSEPAYTVRISMPHPNVSGDDTVRLTALTWIVVQAEPAIAVLERPEKIYVTDGGTLDIQWTLENYTNQKATLTIWRVEEDNATSVIYEEEPNRRHA